MTKIAAVVLLVVTIILSGGPVFAAPFVLNSTSFSDGAQLSVNNAATGNDAGGTPCGGKNQSPQVSWSGAPSDAKSFAVTMIDVDGHHGAGVTHWLLYNIPPDVASIPAGISSTLYSNGKNVYGKSEYTGPCTTLGEAPHHYQVTVFALDIPPTLDGSLDRDALMKVILPHALREMSMLGTFHR